MLCRNHGYTGSYSAMRRFLQQLAAAQPQVCTTMRLDFDPAEAAQVDFGAGPTITDVHTGEVFKTWVLVMTLCWSRHQYAEVVRDQTIATWLGCHRRAFAWFGGVPGRIIIDSEVCDHARLHHRPSRAARLRRVRRRLWLQDQPVSTARSAEEGHRRVRREVRQTQLPAAAQFRDLADANRQLQEWVLGTAGTRSHGTTREQPLARFATERSLLDRAAGASAGDRNLGQSGTSRRTRPVRAHAVFGAVPLDGPAVVVARHGSDDPDLP